MITARPAGFPEEEADLLAVPDRDLPASRPRRVRHARGIAGDVSPSDGMPERRSQQPVVSMHRGRGHRPHPALPLDLAGEDLAVIALNRLRPEASQRDMTERGNDVSADDRLIP